MAFRSFLSHIPWEDQLKFEAYCETVFLLAMAMAGQECDCQQSVGSGKLDVHLKTRDGNDYVIELKFVPVKVKDKEGNDKDLTDEQIREDMEKALTAAMKQIEDRQYALKFQGQDNKIYKTALVVSGRADVRVALEAAANWSLVKDPGQPYCSL
jgi:hypothetical protein